MNLSEYEAAILQSRPSDWTVEHCWGAGSGPSYRQEVTVLSRGDEFVGLEVKGHSMVGSLKTDLSIAVAWGFPLNEDFREEWTRGLPDPTAASHYVDFFLNGSLVFRDAYVSVDGRRVDIPLPEKEIDQLTNKIRRLTIARPRSDFFRMLNGFTSTVDYDGYLRRTGIEIVEASWMLRRSLRCR